MDSGIKPSPETTALIAETEAKKNWAFLIMEIGKLDGARHDTVNVVEKLTLTEAEAEFAAAKDAGVKIDDGELASWYSFRTHLAKYEIAFGLGFLQYSSTQGGERSKLVYIYYNRNDAAPMTKTMKYSTTKIYRKVKSLAKYLECSVPDDITWKAIAEGEFKLK